MLDALDQYSERGRQSGARQGVISSQSNHPIPSRRSCHGSRYLLLLTTSSLATGDSIVRIETLNPCSRPCSLRLKLCFLRACALCMRRGPDALFVLGPLHLIATHVSVSFASTHRGHGPWRHLFFSRITCIWTLHLSRLFLLTPRPKSRILPSLPFQLTSAAAAGYVISLIFLVVPSTTFKIDRNQCTDEIRYPVQNFSVGKKSILQEKYCVRKKKRLCRNSTASHSPMQRPQHRNWQT